MAVIDHNETQCKSLHPKQLLLQWPPQNVGRALELLQDKLAQNVEISEITEETNEAETLTRTYAARGRLTSSFPLRVARHTTRVIKLKVGDRSSNKLIQPVNPCG